MNEIRMIVVDMDATLLNSDKALSAYTLDVLSKCRSRGLDIVPATARAYKNCVFKGFIADVAPYGGVYNDGAVVIVGGKEIFARTIAHQTALDVYRLLAAEPACRRIILDGPDGYFVNADMSNPANIGSYGYLPAYNADCFANFENGAYELAIELTGDMAEALRLADLLRCRFDDIHLTCVVDDLLLIAPVGVNKFGGVARLAEHAGVKLENIVVFGDSLNDLEMIQQIPNSVAVGNARDEVKAAARWVCDTNDQDGVARWLETYVLGGKQCPM